jgi:hypothetical protein
MPLYQHLDGNGERGVLTIAELNSAAAFSADAVRWQEARRWALTSGGDR